MEPQCGWRRHDQLNLRELRAAPSSNVPVSAGPLDQPEGRNAAQRIRDHLAGVMRLRASAAADAPLQRALLALKAWQAARLARTYADLHASTRYSGATQFFLEELYGARDFSQRDMDIERILPKLTRLLPETALNTIAGAVELDELSEQLDSRVAAAHGTGAVDEASYAAAYRTASTPEARTRQIYLLNHIGHELDRLTRVPMLYATLKLMRGPARLAGLDGLQQFLEQGFMHCKNMQGVDEFLGTIVSRETRVMQRLFAGAAAPFAGLTETG